MKSITKKLPSHNKIVKFSKEIGNIAKIKEDFFTNNDNLLKEAININDFYKSQSPRVNCKNCGYTKLKEDFVSFGVSYGICRNCGHLNGLHEDNEEFVAYLYAEDDGNNYKESYLKDYDNRVQGIYIPKVNFLSEVIGGGITMSMM